MSFKRQFIDGTSELTEVYAELFASDRVETQRTGDDFSGDDSGQITVGSLSMDRAVKVGDKNSSLNGFSIRKNICADVQTCYLNDLSRTRPQKVVSEVQY